MMDDIDFDYRMNFDDDALTPYIFKPSSNFV